MNHKGQLGVQHLAQGYANMQIGGAGDQAADLPIGRRPVLSPESQPPLKPSSQSKLTN